MHMNAWLTKLRKSTRSKRVFKSPKGAQVFAISLVALIAVTGLVLAAYQARPASKVVPVVAQPAATQPDDTAPARTSSKKSNAHAATASAQAPERVTITGCLEQHHDEFRLKDTAGADVPKSRSWKTGFLTKHTASVTVLDERNRLKLANHVGERVSVTGMLVDRELDGRSISRVADSCD